MKTQLRRLNQLTGNSGTKAASAHIPALAAMYVHCHPGVENVLKALANYRMSVSDLISPSEAFVNTDWVFPE